MKMYLVKKEYLINKGYGWQDRAEPENVIAFEAPTEREAVKYFKKRYGGTVNIWEKAFYKRNNKKIETYILHKYIATAVCKEKEEEK